MGPRVMRRPPKYVQGFIDQHGKPRFYFRRPGFKSIALPGLPWSPEFMVIYEEALAGQPAQVGRDRVKPGTIRALAISYYNSLAFRSMGPSTQSVYRNIIDRFCREKDKEGHEHGGKRAANLQDRGRTRDPGARGSPGHYGRERGGADDVSRHRAWQAVHGRGVRQLVPRTVRHGELAPLLGAWVAESDCAPARRGGLHRA
jgi:hypothetical protein